MGCRRAIYESIRDLLGEKFPSLSYIALDKGQMQNGREEYPIALPAVLIAMPHITWRDTTNGELGDVTLRISHYQDVVGDAYRGSENEVQDLAMLDAQDEVRDALIGFTANGILSGLMRRTDDVTYGNRWICTKSEYYASVLLMKPEGNKCVLTQLKVERDGKE